MPLLQVPTAGPAPGILVEVFDVLLFQVVRVCQVETAIAIVDFICVAGAVGLGLRAKVWHSACVAANVLFGLRIEHRFFRGLYLARSFPEMPQRLASEGQLSPPMDLLCSALASGGHVAVGDGSIHGRHEHVHADGGSGNGPIKAEPIVPGSDGILSRCQINKTSRNHSNSEGRIGRLANLQDRRLLFRKRIEKASRSMFGDLRTRIQAHDSRLVLGKQDGGAALGAPVDGQGELTSSLGHMRRLRSSARRLAKRPRANLGRESCLYCLGATAFSDNEVALALLLRHIGGGGNLVHLALAGHAGADGEDGIWIGDRVLDIQTEEDSLITALEIAEMVDVGPVGRTGTGISTQTGTVVSMLAIVAVCDGRGQAQQRGKEDKRERHLAI